MKTRSILSSLFVLAVSTPAAFSQSDSEIKRVRRDMDAVRDGVKVIQYDIEKIKELLQQRSGGSPQPEPFRERTINIDGAPFIGDKDAKVAVVEFSDYQCPVSGLHFKQTYLNIEKDYFKTGKVKYFYRDFPLERLHPFAFKASEAARCSGEQGKYWQMHDKLFSNQTSLAANDLIAYAKALGLDQPKFKACLESGKEAAKIRDDMEEGRKVGVVGTPGFFFGFTQPDGKTIKAVQFVSG